MHDPSRTWFRLAAILCALALMASACGDDGSQETSAGDDATVPEGGGTAVEDAINVPGDHDTIQAAVDAASPGDLILIEPGVYHESVQVQTENLVIRGLDRNEVILDGEFDEDFPHGFQVFANGVAIENLTTRNFTSNGVFFTGSYDDDFVLTGYRASYITAHNNGDYGIYAFNASEGLFEHSYGSGHPDSAVYVGQCRPCNAVVTDITAENNALGYSGTNASGNLWVINSEWRNNRVGMVPNTLSSEELGPQGDGIFAGNYVHDNGNDQTPRKGGDWDLAFGVGLVVAGGNGNTVTKNLVTDNGRGGIAVSLFPSGDDIFTASQNQVTDNIISGSGLADLVLIGTADGMNCFSGNEFDTSLPPNLEEQAPCEGEMASELTGEQFEIVDEEYQTIDYTEVPAPDLAFENMPDAATAPARPAIDMMPTGMSLDGISAPTP